MQLLTIFHTIYRNVDDKPIILSLWHTSKALWLS